MNQLGGRTSSISILKRAFHFFAGTGLPACFNFYPCDFEGLNDGARRYEPGGRIERLFSGTEWRLSKSWPVKGPPPRRPGLPCTPLRSGVLRAIGRRECLRHKTVTKRIRNVQKLQQTVSGRQMVRGNRESCAATRTSTHHEAHVTVFTGMLIAVPGRFPEAVEIAFLVLPLAVKRSQSLFEARSTQPVRIPLKFRLPFPPRHLASKTLVLHRSPSPNRVKGIRHRSG